MHAAGKTRTSRGAGRGNRDTRGSETPREARAWVTAQTGQHIRPHWAEGSYPSPPVGHTWPRTQRQAPPEHVYEGEGYGGGWRGESEQGGSLTQTGVQGRPGGRNHKGHQEGSGRDAVRTQGVSTGTAQGAGQSCCSRRGMTCRQEAQTDGSPHWALLHAKQLQMER